jgi:uncharacterized protein (TIGR02271 family)
MDAERLDFERGARVVAADDEVGRLTHVVADPDTRDVLEVVVGRDEGEWILPLAAVRAASRDLVELRRPWSALPARPFEPTAFDRVAHFTIHRRADAAGDQAARLELRAEEVVLHRSREQVGAVAVGKAVVADRRVVEVPVVREEIVVERRTVEPRPADEPIGEPRVVTIPLRAERVRVERVKVVREEVAVARRTVEETQAVVESVRREEAVVATRGAVTSESTEGEHS